MKTNQQHPRRPAAATDASGTISAPRANALDHHAPRRFAARKIVIVEDEPVVLGFVRTVLQRRGHQVLTAGSVDEAEAILAEVAAENLCLVIDVVLGDESGIAFAHEVIEREPSSRVLLISGFTDDVLIGHPEHSNRMGFLRKPFTRDELVHSVDAVCESGT